jgi:pectin methylesterase-like acyl-CoA thioesterase
MKRNLLFVMIITAIGVFTVQGYLGEEIFAGEKTILASKIDVWDFGAGQFDTEIYNVLIDSATINSWYSETVVPGSSGNTLPGFSAGKLSFVTNGTNDRLRTTNTKLTRFDENIAGAIDYTGRVYINSGANTGRYLQLTLNEDDEVTIITRTDAGGDIHFQYEADPELQTDVYSVSDLTELHFVAKTDGVYRVFDNKGKPSYFRVYRKDAKYVTINGTVNTDNAPDIAAGYGISFTNEAGKIWTALVSDNSFTITLPADYNYLLNLTDASGYIIMNQTDLYVSALTETHNVVIGEVELFTLSGSITGLDASDLNSLSLIFTPDPDSGKFYMPEPEVNTSTATFSVKLEADCEYTISAQGVNDYYIPVNTITLEPLDTEADIAFAPKPLYNVVINTTGLDEVQLSKLVITYSNIDEPGYGYSFNSSDPVLLRDGVYSLSVSGLDEYALKMNLTSNLTIAGADATKTLSFSPVKVWSFDDQVITSSTMHYKGLQLSENIVNEITKGHLVTKPGAYIVIPSEAGERLKISYYFSASFTINSDDVLIGTSSGSTNTIEHFEYVSTQGHDTIFIDSGASTTYLTEISITPVVDYEPVIYVGTDKLYKTINQALESISYMTRSSDQRVTVLIDPGNYEEMLVVTQHNVTLKNAAPYPGNELLNKGVDIAENAVRITGYYGHGYSYYSMDSNQKWNADVLQVNKENGHLSYENKGAGTSNGSFWNATVVIAANGFVAEDIIFENSFNQYVSKKESEDVVVEWVSGGKGTRPADLGNTSVQQRSFVERAAAIALANNSDKAVFNRCRIVGRQDTFFGGSNTRVVIYKGAVMGAVDFIFGPMTAVFYKTNLVMNTSDASVDAAYITAAQQSSGRGFLMYSCHIRSAVPGMETASTYYSKPGYFGRPWKSQTSEVVFYNAIIDTTNFTGNSGQSLIEPEGWMSTLGGESPLMYEYGTTEISAIDNSGNRASWSTVLTEPVLTDGTEITTLNFTKGSDGWDPIPLLIAEKRNLLVVPDDKNSVYGDDLPELTLRLIGLDSYENATVLDVAPVVQTSATPASDAGSYKITASGADSDAYEISYAEGNIMITKAPLVATAEDKNREIGEPNPDFTIIYEGFVNNDDVSDITPPDVSCQADENSPAGTYDIVLSGGSAKNYEITLVNGVLNIISTVDVLEIDNDHNVILYPNPARDILHIRKFPAGTIISVIDLTGRVLLRKEANGENVILNISTLPSGAYWIQTSQEVQGFIKM